MPTIIITERQQALTAARDNESWGIESASQVWEDGWDGEGNWRNADALIFTAGGVVQFVVQAEFNRRNGELIEAKIVHSRVEFANGGLRRVIKSIETTHDWDTFITWIVDSEALFRALH